MPPLPPLLQVAIRGSAEFRKDALGISKVSTNSGVLPAVKAAAEKVPAAAAAILLQLGEPGGGAWVPAVAAASLHTAGWQLFSTRCSASLPVDSQCLRWIRLPDGCVCASLRLCAVVSAAGAGQCMAAVDFQLAQHPQSYVRTNLEELCRVASDCLTRQERRVRRGRDSGQAVGLASKQAASHSASVPACFRVFCLPACLLVCSCAACTARAAAAAAAPVQTDEAVHATKTFLDHWCGTVVPRLLACNHQWYIISVVHMLGSMAQPKCPWRLALFDPHFDSLLPFAQRVSTRPSACRTCSHALPCPPLLCSTACPLTSFSAPPCPALPRPALACLATPHHASPIPPHLSVQAVELYSEYDRDRRIGDPAATRRSCRNMGRGALLLLSSLLRRWMGMAAAAASAASGVMCCAYVECVWCAVRQCLVIRRGTAGWSAEDHWDVSLPHRHSPSTPGSRAHGCGHLPPQVCAPHCGRRRAAAAGQPPQAHSAAAAPGPRS